MKKMTNDILAKKCINICIRFIMDTPQTRLSPLEKVQLQIKTLQNKVVFLTEENKQLKQTIKELKRASRPARSSRDRIDTA